MATVIDTQGLRPAEREELWRHAMTDTFVSVSIGEFSERGAHGTIGANWLGDLMIGEVNASGQDIHRTPRHINRAPAEYFQVAIMSDGIGKMSQDGRQAVLHPGDALVYETNRPFEWLFDGNWNTWVFSFPAEAVPLSIDERRLLTARRLDGTDGLTGLVSRFLMDLARNSQELSASNPQRLMAHATDLIVTMLSRSIEPTDATRRCVQRTIVLRVKDYVARHLHDPALTPPEVAAACGISTRYLHKLFEAQGQSVSEYIRERRLERAYRDLLDPSRASLTITAIATRAGFGDISGFNKAFRKRYRLAPRDVRHGADGG